MGLKDYSCFYVKNLFVLWVWKSHSVYCEKFCLWSWDFVDFIVCVRMAVIILIEALWLWICVCEMFCLCLCLSFCMVLFVFVIRVHGYNPYWNFAIVRGFICDVFVVIGVIVIVILIQNIFMRVRENTPTLVRNLLVYLNLSDRHTCKNTLTFLQRTSGSPSK